MFIIRSPSTRDTIINSDIGMTNFDLVKKREPLPDLAPKECLMFLQLVLLLA